MLGIPVGFDVMMAFRCACLIAAIGAGWFLVDAIGDAREAKVYRKINSAIEKVNAEAAKAGELDDKLAVLADGVRQKALADARAIPAIAPVCPATKTQAEALNRIK